jgi:hypothetical protein
MTDKMLWIDEDRLTNEDGRTLAATFMRLGVAAWQVRAAWADRTRFRAAASLPLDTPEACDWSTPEE